MYYLFLGQLSVERLILGLLIYAILIFVLPILGILISVLLILVVWQLAETSQGESTVVANIDSKRKTLSHSLYAMMYDIACVWRLVYNAEKLWHHV